MAYAHALSILFRNKEVADRWRSELISSCPTALLRFSVSSDFFFFVFSVFYLKFLLSEPATQLWRFSPLDLFLLPDCFCSCLEPHASLLLCFSCFVWIRASVVPPKPAHLLALGQDKKPKRIPPAPSRPLPAPPLPPKPKPTLTPPGQGAQPQREAQKVGLLIERFENSR